MGKEARLALLNSLRGLASWAPCGGPGGDSSAIEFCFTLRAAATFFPAVLEEPVFRWDIRDVAPGGEAIG